MECFDPVKCEPDGDRGKVPINVESVVEVMGVPMGLIPVPYHQDVDATSLILEMMGINSGKQPTLAQVEEQLGPNEPTDEKFLKKFIMFLTSLVFAPTTEMANFM
jgi:hypothetical protein